MSRRIFFWAIAVVLGSFFVTEKTLAQDITCADLGTYSCIDVKFVENQSSCQTNMCPGGSNVRCCPNHEIVCKSSSGENAPRFTKCLFDGAEGNCNGSGECATTTGTASQTTSSSSSSTSGKCGVCPAGQVCLVNPLSACSVEEFLVLMLTYLKNIIGIISITFIVIGGVMYVISAGDKDMIEKAKKTITGAVIGLAITIVAPTLLREVYVILGGTGSANLPAEVSAAPSLVAIAAKVLDFILSGMGVIAMTMMVIGGIMYLVSSGDQDLVTKGKTIFKYSLIGVIISMSALILVKQIAVLLAG